VHKYLKYMLAIACLLPLNSLADHTLGYNAAATISSYTSPEASGLIGVRPYPNPSDVCQVIAENDTTLALIHKGTMLIACPKHETGAIQNRINENAHIVAHAKHWSILRVPGHMISQDQLNKQKNRNSKLVSTIEKILSNSTLTSWSKVHGTQVEYHDAKGGVWLAYPGNKKVLFGQWRVDSTQDTLKVCYRYNTSGHNPATGVIGYDWECGPWENITEKGHTTHFEGDVFKLYKRGSFPDSPKLREKLSTKQLLQLFGISSPPLVASY